MCKINWLFKMYFVLLVYVLILNLLKFECYCIWFLLFVIFFIKISLVLNWGVYLVNLYVLMLNISRV